MSVSRTDAARLISHGLCVGALLCVVTLTLIDRGSTRAYATPWIYLFWFAHVAPLLALALRAFSSASPLNLPGRSWCILAAISAFIILLSASLSPFPGPSLLAALTPLSGLAVFFLVHDASRQNGEYLAESFLRAIALVSVAIVAVSVLRWSAGLISSGAYRNVATLLNGRNEFPLGHSNYTAGLALFVIPWLGFLAWRSWGLARWGWTAMTFLALIMLVSSGSRGGLLGAGALAVLALSNARVNRRMLVLLSFLGVVVVLALGYAHPRTRAMVFSRHTQVAEPNASNVQRSAMAIAGWRMGADRPALGWGPGLTPLVYPRYRAGLDGGVDTALQLHSTPVQVWADLGIGGVACAIGFAFMVWRDLRAWRSRRLSLRGGSTKQSSSRTAPAMESSIEGNLPQLDDHLENLDGLPLPATRARNDNPGNSFPAKARLSDSSHSPSGSRHPLATPAFVSFGGYAVFALTDYQLDVPIFTLAVATCAAFIARSGQGRPSRTQQFALAAAVIAVLATIGAFGRRDPTPEINVRALAIGAEPAKADEAIQLLRQSLELNPDQEIAHFNLGWLLLVRDPAAAEQHFLTAAHLVPDKGGVYFGIALSRLNQNQSDTAPVVRALALECLNDPRFLISPWWREPNLAALRDATITELRSLASGVALRLADRNDRRSRDADYIAALGEWLDGRGAPGEILALSHTSGRVSYFAARPAIPDWKNALVKAYRRERPGYPVLMRNLDLPRPVDLFQVQENSLATGELAELFPPKGWLPAPLLIELLGEAKSGRR